jgi:uncharacterized protein YabE (DUF348 family)
LKEDKAHILRKTVIAITLILIFVTTGLFLISIQLNTITLNYFGEAKKLKTLSGTVDSFLIENKIYLSENMEVSPSKDTLITEGMEIKIYSNQNLAKLNFAKLKSDYQPIVVKIEEVIETMPFEEEKRDNPTINRGTSQVSQEGKEGQKSTKYIVKYSNEQEIERSKISTEVISPTVNKVLDVGTKINAVVSRSAVVQSVVANSQNTDGFKQYNIKLPYEQQLYAYNISKKYGIQYELFLAIMYKESGFNTNAFGGGNSYGLCQIHISNHSNLRSKLGISDFFNPYDNMTAGAYLLSKYFGTARTQVSGDTIEVYALNSYNMGEGAYFTTCFSKGIVNRGYSDAVRSIRNRIIANGGL